VELEPLWMISCFASDDEYVKAHRSEAWDKMLDHYNETNALGLKFGIIKYGGMQNLDDLLDALSDTDMSKEDMNVSFLAGIINTWINNYPAAIQSYNKAVGLDEDFLYGWFNRAVAKTLQLRNADSGEDAPFIGLSETPSTTSEPIDYSSAIDDMTEAILSYSKWAAAWYNRATIKAYSGDYQGAISDYTEAIKLAPKMAEAYYNRGLILIFTKRTQKACPDLSKAGELGISTAYNIIKRYCK
jgi:tetratricopeptide (TPR) repeat protein